MQPIAVLMVSLGFGMREKAVTICHLLSISGRDSAHIGLKDDCTEGLALSQLSHHLAKEFFSLIVLLGETDRLNPEKLGQKLAAVAPNSTILPVKVLDSESLLRDIVRRTGGLVRKVTVEDLEEREGE